MVQNELILGAHESQNKLQAASKSTYKLCKSTYKVCKPTYKPKGVPEELILEASDPPERASGGVKTDLQTL